MTEKFTLSPDDNEEKDVKIAVEETIPAGEPYVVASVLFGLTVLAFMNILFEGNTTILIVSALSGFMAWLVLTAFNRPLNHLVTASYAGIIGVLLNTAPPLALLNSRNDVKSAMLYIILGGIYGYAAYRLSKETRDISQLIYFVLFSSFIVRGIIFLKTGI